ncbi:MAG: hypothetical protein NTX03_08325 [Bacteroidetes bacterium]|nr:hypothetical protein [Bacteroidota bacterium]
MKYLSFFLLYLIALHPIQAKKYYVAAFGNDNFAGTSIAKAWQSITKVNSINFKPGDTLYFEGGKSFKGDIYLDSLDANNPDSIFTITSYGNGRAIIDGLCRCWGQ